MAVWFTSDQHFGHRAVIDMCGRPFSSVEEMDEHMIQAWNSVVRPGDQVHHLGDFMYKSSVERTQQIFSRLNGEKHLTVGNHDKAHVRALPWASEPDKWRLLSVDGVRIFACHYGFRTWPGLHRGVLHLYGHSHDSMPGTRQSQDVGVDAMGYAPVSIQQVIARMAMNADIEGVARPSEPEPTDEPEEDGGGFRP
jgi:calcineurin-like phosphoesterase family protein